MAFLYMNIKYFNHIHLIFIFFIPLIPLLLHSISYCDTQLCDFGLIYTTWCLGPFFLPEVDKICSTSWLEDDLLCSYTTFSLHAHNTPHFPYLLIHWWIPGLILYLAILNTAHTMLNYISYSSKDQCRLESERFIWDYSSRRLRVH